MSFIILAVIFLRVDREKESEREQKRERERDEAGECVCVVDVFVTVPLIPLQSFERARSPQLRCHQLTVHSMYYLSGIGAPMSKSQGHSTGHVYK